MLGKVEGGHRNFLLEKVTNCGGYPRSSLRDMRGGKIVLNKTRTVNE